MVHAASVTDMRPNLTWREGRMDLGSGEGRGHVYRDALRGSEKGTAEKGGQQCLLILLLSFPFLGANRL